ncbi:hypothetical protein [Mesorhizobium escarrei]|uniref:Uncharacterized protein n=1 Tax=Mesorhizobium escarrei TaxID=666018 RepID=A0ABM9EB76_9HYPH|nr:hypothetical protein [Mesorhizobium escarrei]CAH2406500.1 hypothetical protein MES5069_520155 [Mesorhizobium escarrei]
MIGQNFAISKSMLSGSNLPNSPYKTKLISSNLQQGFPGLLSFGQANPAAESRSGQMGMDNRDLAAPLAIVERAHADGT